MTAAYLDTSAAVKLVVEDAESAALVRWVDDHPDLVGTLLLETELRRAATRMQVPQALVTEVLRRVTLHELTAGSFREAGALPGAHLRSLDALHLVAALRLGCRSVVTYDERMAEAAAGLGFDVVAPGAGSGG